MTTSSEGAVEGEDAADGEREGSAGGGRGAIGALLAALTSPPRAAAELAGAAATAGVELVTTGSRLLGAVEELVRELAAVTARLDALLGTAERLTGRVEAVVDRAEGAVHVVDDVLASVGEAVGRAQHLVAGSDAIRARAAALVEELEPLAERVDAALLDEAVTAVRQLPHVLGRLEEQVLPTVRSLGGLVPVVDRLNANVDGLHDIVGDVGALLAGIPGSARLLRRGERSSRGGVGVDDPPADAEGSA